MNCAGQVLFQKSTAIPLLADFLWWTNIKQSNMKNKSNTHYTAPISVEITATAISREHVHFKNKHAGPSFYLASWPNTSLNFSSEEHEHPLKQKITTSWKSDQSGVWSSWANGKEGEKKKISKGKKKTKPTPKINKTNENRFWASAPPIMSLPERYTSNLRDTTIQSVSATGPISLQVWKAHTDHTSVQVDSKHELQFSRQVCST